MSIYRTLGPLNEPARTYAPGSAERTSVQRELGRQAGDIIEIPCVIDGKGITALPWGARGAWFLLHKAEIAAACEFIDFWRFNVSYHRDILTEQASADPRGIWIPLADLVFAVTPVNFTSIALNLTTAAALCGNTVVWTAATTSALACQHLFQRPRAAARPGRVINLVNVDGPDVAARVLVRAERALTVGMFARAVIESPLPALRRSTGNLYITDKPTGAICTFPVKRRALVGMCRRHPARRSRHPPRTPNSRLRFSLPLSPRPT